METFNNTTRVVRDDLAKKIKTGSKLSLAAACFSMYVYQALKKNLKAAMNSGLFLHRPHLLRKRRQKNVGNFIFPVCSARKVFMGQNLKYVCEMS